MKPSTYLLSCTSAAALLGVIVGAIIVRAPSREPDFHAIVERNGTVVLCLSGSKILFADRCTGSGLLTIVQPFDEGPTT